MSEFDYDEDRDPIYVSEDAGFGWFLLALLLAAPFLVLEKYARFSLAHPVIAWGGFLAFSVLVGWLTCRRRKAGAAGFLAVLIAMAPVGLTQMIYLVPFICSGAGGFSIALEWLTVTAATVGVTVLVVQVGLLLSHAARLVLASAWLVAVLLFLL